MKRAVFILLILINCSMQAQNLVPNGGFENYSACPTASGQLTLAVNWINPSNVGTPDYLNACSSIMGVPIAGLGFQYAKSGNGMAGIWAFCNTFINFREYIQCQLTMPLITNNFYLIEYYVNRANWSNFACNNISCLISSTASYTSGSNGLISANPQISKFNNDIIIDTLNWIKVSGLYQASGSENYITIGNFKNDALTNYSNVPGTSSSCAAYYLIDDVSVTNITTPQWQYRDTTVYLGDSVLIGPAITGLNVDWFTMSSTFIKNAPGIYVKPTVTTSYKATETFNSVAYNHTVTVTVLVTKVNEYEQLQNSVKIFPNPGNGKFNLQFADITKGNVDVTICDVTGKVVYENKLQVANALTNFDIDVKGGIYFVKIYDNTLNKTLIKKLVIQQ